MSDLSERQHEALRLRNKGLAYYKIAAEMGVSRQRAQQLVQAAIHRLEHAEPHQDCPICVRSFELPPRVRPVEYVRCAYCDHPALWWYQETNTLQKISLCDAHLRTIDPGAWNLRPRN